MCADTASSEHRFGSLLTAEWFQHVRQQCPPNTTPHPFSCFWDPTVRMSTGAKYCVLQLYDHRLPLDGACAHTFPCLASQPHGLTGTVARPLRSAR